MLVRGWCVLCCLVVVVVAHAGDGGPLPGSAQGPALMGSGASVPDSAQVKENERLVAAALALFLGPFGAHRLYFGTTAKVPIIYGITFGGFGILAVLDLGHILFTRDLSRYHDCDRVFMWGQGRRATTPP